MNTFSSLETLCGDDGGERRTYASVLFSFSSLASIAHVRFL